MPYPSKLDKQPNAGPAMSVDVIKDKAGWGTALAELGEHDFTHTFDFHEISMMRGEGEPQAYAVRDGSGRVQAMWPVLKRAVPGQNAHDFTSVYGYSGPVLRPTAESGRVLATIFEAMRNSGAVSLFSRMHPLFMDRLEGDDRGDQVGEIVVVDVGSSNDGLSGYRGSHRREIVNARAKGVTTSIETGPAAVRDFHRIYHLAMTDLAASQYYLFDAEYIASLEAASGFKTLFLFANLNGERIGAAMFIVTGGIMQYYLSGTISAFRKLVPSKVIIAEAHRLATEMKLKKLVLGGGVGSGQDALLAFKKGFSPLTLPFHVTRRVLDEARYTSLCAKAGIDPATERFFPAYRAAAA